MLVTKLHELAWLTVTTMINDRQVSPRSGWGRVRRNVALPLPACARGGVTDEFISEQSTYT